MNKISTFALALTTVALASCSSSPKDLGQQARPSTQAEKTFSRSIAEGINRERMKAGMNSLLIKEDFSLMSRKHTRFLLANTAKRPSFGSTNAHRNFVFRSRKANSLGYPLVGEIVLGGNVTGDQVDQTIEAWMNSKTHKRHILGTGYTHIGVGTTLGEGKHFQVAALFGGKGVREVPILSSF